MLTLPKGVLIDTGRFYPEGIDIDDQSKKTDHFFNLMTKHAELAIDESDLVLMVCDVREGLLPYDESIANYVRSKQKKFFVLLNKFDGTHLEDEIIQFYSLGVDEEQIYPVSASHGLGFDFLRTRINEEALFSVNSKIETGLAVQRGIIPREKVISKVAIVGSPNAGKSTLLNAVGEERALVSDIREQLLTLLKHILIFILEKKLMSMILLSLWQKIKLKSLPSKKLSMSI